MEIELYHHVIIFAYSLLLGLGAGVVLDLFMVLNHLLGIRRLTCRELSLYKIGAVKKIREFFSKHCRFKHTYEYIGLIVTDILCSLLIGVSLSVFVFHANHGKLRWFLLTGVLLGILSYKISIGKLTKRLISVIIYITAEGIYWLIKVLMAPLKFTFKIFKRVIKILLCPVLKLADHIRHRIYARKTNKIERNLKVLIRMN